MFGNKKDKIDSYIDSGNEYSNQELKMSEWYLRHKIALGHLFIFLLIFWCVISVTGSLMYWGYYLLIGANQDEQMSVRQSVEFSNYEQMHSLYGAEELIFQGQEIYESATNRYDFVARAINPNKRWVAILTYKFSFAEKDTETQTTIILPNTKRPLIIFGQEATSYPSGVKLVVLNVRWRQINAHDVFDTDSFIKERTNFRFDNFKFIPENRAYGYLNNSVAFDWFNDSPYSYHKVDLYIELFNSGETVGFIYLPVQKFRTREQRHLEGRIMGGDLYVNDIQVYPVVNVFDSGEYINPGEII